MGLGAGASSAARAWQAVALAVALVLGAVRLVMYALLLLPGFLQARV
jgi:hypothetical protein